MRLSLSAATGTIGRLAVMTSGLAFAGGCFGSFPHVREQRTHTASQRITISNLPDGARIVHELPNEEHRVLVAHARGNVNLAFPYELTEDLENGAVKAATPKRADVTLTLHAPGHMPRRVVVPVPGDGNVDGRLSAPSVAWIANGSADLDAARIALLEGRCGVGDQLLAALDETSRTALQPLRAECTIRSKRRDGDDGSRDWDPAALAIPQSIVGSARGMALALEATMAREEDETAVRGLVTVDRLARAGRLNEAAKIAQLVAQPLPAKRAALVLALPAASYASTKLDRARADLSQNDTRAAFEHATDALAIAPVVSASSYATVRAIRVQALVQNAQSRERASDVLGARAYWTAAATLDPSSREAQEGWARTTAAMIERIRTRLALRANDAATGQLLKSALGPLLPRHVMLIDDDSHADAFLGLAVSDAMRTFRVTTTQRTKSVLAFTVTKPNPAVAEARREVESAEQGLNEAREEYERLHEAAQDMAGKSKQGGVAGAFAGSAAVAEETAAVAIVRTAEARLRNARAALQRTPATIKEDVFRDTAYPVILYEANAKRKVVAKLDGFGEPLETVREATTSILREQTVASPEIGVDATASPEAELKSLSPDISKVIAEVAAAIGSRVVTAERAQAEKVYANERARGDAVRSAAAAVIYLEMLPPDAAETREILRWLVEELP